MANLEIIYLSFIMGIAGSFHCLGMCGPIAMALPLSGRSKDEKLFGVMLYNAGRIFTYASLGLVLGFAGDYLFTPNIQSTVSIFFGIAILVYLCLPKGFRKKPLQFGGIQRTLLQLRTMLGKFLSQKSNASLFSIGLLNGLLPCGMIYLALASSFLTGSAIKGSLFMASFGLGTFPLMMMAAYFGSFINQSLRLKVRKLIPLFLFAMAVLLLLRGLNLGLPFISPLLPESQEATPVVCH